MNRAAYKWQRWEEVKRERKRERTEALVWLTVALIIVAVPLVYWYIITK